MLIKTACKLCVAQKILTYTMDNFYFTKDNLMIFMAQMRGKTVGFVMSMIFKALYRLISKR